MLTLQFVRHYYDKKMQKILNYPIFEIQWLQKIIAYRLNHLQSTENFERIAPIPILGEKTATTNYAEFLAAHNFAEAERLAIALVMARAVEMEIFVPIVEPFKDAAFRYVFGGDLKGKSLRFIPTFQTLCFLLARRDKERQAYYIRHFHKRHPLFLNGIVMLYAADDEQNLLNHQLEISEAYLRYFLGGAVPRLDTEGDFPATLAHTHLSFEDVVLGEKVRIALKDLTRLIQHKKRLLKMDGVKGRVRSSHVLIFSGEPGTGKTLTAKTIGKSYNIPVYIVNLARIVSKYIGETEKNLERVFDRFDNKDCILFFDEADALFGKRTEVKDSKDRYANQEVAFLLQKIEAFNGIVILATNVSNVEQTFDKAFQRRIWRQIKFSFPNYKERLLLWEKALPKSFQYAAGLLDRLAKNYQLTGASIQNIVSDGLLYALDEDTRILTYELLEAAMKAEYLKRGMPFRETTDEMVKLNPQRRVGNPYRRNF